MIKESFEYNSDIVNDLSSPGKPEDASFMREASSFTTCRRTWK